MKPKTCTLCGTLKQPGEFYKNAKHSTGLSSWCRVCTRARVKKRKEQNPEKVRQEKRLHYQNNRDRYKELGKARLRDHKKEYISRVEKVGVDAYRSECRERSSLYRARNREKINRKARERRDLDRDWYTKMARDYRHRQGDEYLKRRRELYYEKPHIYRARRRERTAIQSTQTPQWACVKEIRSIYEQARLLRDRHGSMSYCVDHIVPLRSEYVCGLHCPDNLTVTTWAENCSKSNNWWPDMPIESDKQ